MVTALFHFPDKDSAQMSRSRHGGAQFPLFSIKLYPENGFNIAKLRTIFLDHYSSVASKSFYEHLPEGKALHTRSEIEMNTVTPTDIISIMPEYLVEHQQCCSYLLSTSAGSVRGDSGNPELSILNSGSKQARFRYLLGVVLVEQAHTY